MANPRAWMDIRIGTLKAGRLTFELFQSVTPKTVENFRALCTGEKGLGKTGRPLHYKGSPFHRIIHVSCQGGDFTFGDGRGGESIYGSKFKDENFTMKHDQEGLLSMANSGPNTNGSQFFVTLVKTPWLDGKHVVFGKLVDGIDVLRKMEAQGTDDGRTKEAVVIEDCGEFS